MENRPIRVLQVFTILNMGGAETNLMNYFRHLDTRKLQFDFLVHREEEGHFEKEIIAGGSKIYRLPPVHPFSLGTYKKAVDDFFREHAGSYDIVHGHLSELGVYIYEAAMKYGVPVRIAHAHNSRMDWDIKAPFRLWWKHRMRKSVNGFFSCGEASSIWLFGARNARKAFIMPNSVEVDRYAPDPGTAAGYREQLGISTPFSFLHIGRFATQKNHRFLVAVFAEIVKVLPEARLFLVGEGELKAEIMAQVQALQLQDNILFLGKRNDVNALMQACDYFLFPSLFEGFSVAFVEAQASGMYSFISDGIPGESVLLKENVMVLSLKETAAAWAGRITERLRSGYARDATAGQKIKAAGYDVHDNTDKLYDAYRRLLNA
ncbi:MAG: hypothetical protein BGO09_12315 [Bacteroidetes bacterium 47-18]|nr:MAG: hypothetical protein BGO09_12315 [Bacteroidetes bacterium 47-18]